MVLWKAFCCYCGKIHDQRIFLKDNSRKNPRTLNESEIHYLMSIGNILKKSTVNGKNAFFVCPKGKIAIKRAMSLTYRSVPEQSNSVCIYLLNDNIKSGKNNELSCSHLYEGFIVFLSFKKGSSFERV